MNNGTGTQINVKFKNSVTGEKKLEKYATQLQTIQAMLSEMDKEKILALSSSLKSVAKETQKVTNQGKKTANLFNFGFKTGSLLLLSKTLTSLSKNMTKLIGLSASYVENVNLLEVAYANINRETGTFNESIESSSERIEKYIDKMSQAYGLDESRLTRQFGIFKQLANAMELPAETGERLSEIMVKMTNDIASLYNLDLTRASNALQSALVGQVRPIRGATGADITEKTLQKTVDNLGLDRSISDLSFVEKRLIMVISLTNQLKVSQGDYARTIESAANQVKIMHEQWDRLSRAVGNVFYPILENMLPYINAILMALTEIFNMLASLFGFKMPEFDYSSLAGISEVAMDIEDEMVGAGDATDELANKLKGLRSFDKLNVINTPSASKTSAVGGGGSGYVDPTIMDAFNNAFDEYDDKLDSVRMKASKIKDDIMHWLGFEKELNEETGKIEWKYKGLGTTLKNMWESFKNLNPLVKTFVGYLALMGAVKIYKGIKNLIETITSSTLGKSLHDIVSYAQIYTKLSGSKTQGILSGVDAWARNATAVEKFQMRLTGATGVIVSMGLTYDAMKKINDEGINLKNSMELLGGTMSGVLGGAMFGSTFGGWGAVIGAVSGAIVDLGMVLIAYETDMDKMVNKSKDALKDVQDTADEIARGIAETEMEITSSMSLTNYHEKLLDELDQVIDSNGKIKSGYEDRASYILNELSSAYGIEYEIVDGVLQEHDKIKQSLKDQIALKEAEIILEAYKEDYIEALKKENELYDDIETQEANRNEQLLELNNLLEDIGVSYEEYVELQKKANEGTELSAEEIEKLNKVEKWRADNWNSVQGAFFKKYEEAYKNYDKAVSDSRKNYEDNHSLVIKYSNFATAVETGNMEEVNKTRDEYTRTWVKDGQIRTNSDETELNKRIYTRSLDLADLKKNDKAKYEDYKNTLTDISNYTDGVTPEIAEKWAVLGQTSSEDFMEEFAKLPEDIQKNIVTQMYRQGVDISEELQKGLDELTPKIKVGTDTSQMTNDLNDWLSRNGDLLGTGSFASKALKLTRYFSYASGGLPPVGQVFVANERGPELVDQIGGQTFVANQKQIGEYMDKRYGSYQQPVNVTIPVSVGGEQLGTIVLNNLQELAKTNGNAITIG